MSLPNPTGRERPGVRDGVREAAIGTVVSAGGAGSGQANLPAPPRDRPSDRLGDRPSDRLGDRPSDRLSDRPSDRSSDRLTGTGPPGPAGQTTDRLPRPPRRRTAGIAALSVLLIAGGAAAAGVLALRLDQRVPMLVAIHDIAPGQQITAADLATSPVAQDGLDLVPSDRQNEVIGRFAAVPIPQGRLIDHRMLAGSGLLRPGKAAVGMVLKAGQAPASGVQPGDVVNVVRTGQDVGTIIAKNAVVSSVRAGETGGFGATTGDTTATVIVDVAESTDVAAAAQGNRIALVLLTRGVPVGTTG